VNDALDVRSKLVDRRVKGESREVHTEGGRAGVDRLPSDVDLHEGRGGDLGVVHAERVDEEVLGVLAHSGLQHTVKYDNEVVLVHFISYAIFSIGLEMSTRQ